MVRLNEAVSSSRPDDPQGAARSRGQQWPQATALQKALGQEPKIVAGRRITDAETLDVMKMTVAGKVNVD